MIEWKDLSFGYGQGEILKNISCRMENGQVVGLIGPNGAGKSTWLRLCARMLRPQVGTILIDGKKVGAYPAKALARQLSYLPQHRPVPAVAVESLVMMGRYAHERNNRQAVEQAIRAVQLDREAKRDLRTLSGGQRQMAYLAMLLAQDSPNVLLDEPFTHLDIGAQLDAAEVICRMKDMGKCVVVVMHDLTLLDKVCDRVLLLNEGTITFDGSAPDGLHSAAFQTAFGVRAVENKSIRFEKCRCFT